MTDTSSNHEATGDVLSSDAALGAESARTGDAAKRGWGLAGVCTGFALVILDANVLNVAVPTLRDQLAASTSALLWIVDAYTLAFAALLLSTGLLGDRWGARLGFQAGLVVFGVASVGCGLAPTVGWLIAARVLQGVGAALLAPTSLALIHAVYPAGRIRVRALGMWAAISGLAFAAGPVVGGGLVQTVGWRGIFLVNVPVCAFALLLVATRLRPVPARPVALDLVGQALAVGTLTAVTAGLIEASRIGWGAPFVVGAFGATALGLALFVLWERSRAEPLIPTAVLTSPPLRAGLLAGAAFNFSMYGSLFVYTLTLQHIRGYAPLLTGLAFLPLTIMHTPVATRLAGPWTANRGPKWPLLTGQLCTLVGSAGFVVAGTLAYPVLAAALLVFGVGSGLITTSMTTLVLAHTPQDSVGVSSGLLNASRQLGGVLGIALLGSLTANHLPDRIPVAEVVATLAIAASVAVTARSLRA
ncbi:MFS transporter [Solihabitans fulvus]|uniref:MFS transporter n=1 Tax=Solihabitans fulvus TaxID=1892852 RepID=UPI001CB76068|nr:MFS transporter [Solihabitans fulvus]